MLATSPLPVSAARDPSNRVRSTSDICPGVLAAALLRAALS